MKVIKFIPLGILLLVTVLSLAQPCAESTSQILLDGNDVETILLNGGDLWWDLSSGLYSVDTIPASYLFAGSLWIGGIDPGGQLHMAAQTYRQTGNDFWPGPLQSDGSTTTSACFDWDRHWKVELADIQLHSAMSVPISIADIPASILEWPATGNPYAKGNGGVPLTVTSSGSAPYIDKNGDDIYDPTFGDYPDVPGDQAIYWLLNDNGGLHTETGGAPLIIQVGMLAYAYDRPGAIKETTFYRYDIRYFGTETLDSVYMGKWVDPDIGAFDDDHIACNPSRNLGICYNGDELDGPGTSTFGSMPPMVALDLLKGPISIGATGDTTRLEMTSFISYKNDFSVTGNPETTDDYYAYLNTRWKDDSPLTQGGDGYGGTLPVEYMYPDEPGLTLPAWSECSEGNMPGDRRFLLNSGPFKLFPGQQMKVDYAVIVAAQEAQSGCVADFNLLFDVEAEVGAFFDSLVCSGAYLNDLGTSVGIWDPSEQLSSLTLYPNPTSSSSILSWDDAQLKGDVQVSVFNMLGEEIKRFDTNRSSFEIKEDKLSSGNYLILISQEGNVLGSKIWIKK